MIVETIVTTTAGDGTINFAPMGVEWGEESLVLKPFLETVTFRNLRASGVAVVNLTDDVLLFARAAISSPQYPAVPALKVAGSALADACSWREVVVRSVDDTPPRSRIVTDVVHREWRREFVGFNRARHAVLETAIYATRTHILAPGLIAGEVTKLQEIVNKTAGPREHEAMDLLTGYIREKLAARAGA